jgi:hypothetical protein
LQDLSNDGAFSAGAVTNDVPNRELHVFFGWGIHGDILRSRFGIIFDQFMSAA